MRFYLALAIVLIAVSIITIQPAFALTETAIPFITTGNAVFVEPLSNTGLTILEFNSDSTSIRDIEQLDISFPAFRRRPAPRPHCDCRQRRSGH